jgi:hypothetical protein
MTGMHNFKNAFYKPAKILQTLLGSKDPKIDIYMKEIHTGLSETQNSTISDIRKKEKCGNLSNQICAKVKSRYQKITRRDFESNINKHLQATIRFKLKYLFHSISRHREFQHDVEMGRNQNQFWQVFLSAN